MNARRTEYRVSPERPYLRAVLHARGHPPIEGYVVDLSGRGVGITLASLATPELARGTKVELVIDALVLSEPIFARARVRRWAQEADALFCGVEFEDPDALDAAIPVALREEFNRRQHPRIPITGRLGVLIERSVGSDYLRGHLIDVSEGGIQLRLDSDDCEQVAKWRRVWVSFVLPGDADELRMGAIVCNREHGRLGLEFDPVRTRDFALKRDAVRAFVERQMSPRR